MEIMYKCACQPLCEGKDHCYTTGKCYAYQPEHSNEIGKNCFPDMEQSLLNCNSDAWHGHFLCCQGDLCNEHLNVRPMPSTAVAVQDEDDLSVPLKIFIIATVAVLSALLCLVVVLVARRHYRKRRADSLLDAEPKLLDDDSICKDLAKMKQSEWSTGSGSGQPRLVIQTVGKQVELLEKIGKGRFGEVWLGKWLDEDVAVKTFSSLEETSWKQETEIYSTGMLRHDNILGYYASDTVGINSCTQNWLIVRYHRTGSLYDYLQRSDIDMEEMLILAHSTSAGLAHLHNEIRQGTGRHGKPAIAHRDIKSKNILVKEDGQCCIGDLGHAVRNDKLLENKPLKLLVGTKRYMAPEVLTERLNPAFFESFKCVDVYAFGLVLWEIARRARPFAEEYHVPFWDVVPSDPSLEEMRRVVADEHQRPPIPNKWSKEPLMCEMARLMSECWAENPKARLTILRVKKNLFNRLRETSGDHGRKMEKLSISKMGDSSSSGNSSGSGTGSGNFSIV